MTPIRAQPSLAVLSLFALRLLSVETHLGSFSTGYELLHKAYSNLSCFHILLKRHLCANSPLLRFYDAITVVL